MGKNKFMIFWAPMPPLGDTYISASRTLIKNRLDESSNLAWRGIHAKFQPNSMIRLARARGVVRFLTYHFMIGRCLYLLVSCIESRMQQTKAPTVNPVQNRNTVKMFKETTGLSVSIFHELSLSLFILA